MKNATKKWNAVRKVIRRGHGSVIGRFQSTKATQPIPYESTGERDYLYRLEVDPDVLEIYAQPTVLRWKDADVVRTHVPDFLIVRARGEDFVEVKPLKEVTLPLFQRRAKFLDAQERVNGRSYSMVSEDWIRAEPAFGNAKILLNGRGQAPTNELRCRVLACLTEKPRSFADLVKTLNQKPYFVNALYALIVAGDLELADPSQQIGWHSQVQKKGA